MAGQRPHSDTESTQVAGCCTQLVSELVSTEPRRRTRVRVLSSILTRDRALGAEGGTRTPTPLRAPAPKAGVSAVSPLPLDRRRIVGQLGRPTGACWSVAA